MRTVVYVSGLSYSQKMTDNDLSHTSEPHPPEDDWPTVSGPEPTPTVTTAREPRGLELSEGLKRRLEQHYLPPGVTVDQLAHDAAVKRAGHQGRHHWAGHPSGRNPREACGEWRPVAGVRCPVCPDVCPGCGSYYATPFPIDPRDMRP